MLGESRSYASPAGAQADARSRLRGVVDRAPILIAPIAAIAAYLPAVVVPYAFMDDYFDLASRQGLGDGFVGTATSYGRPFQGFFLAGAFSLASDLDSVRLVRLVSLLGVMLLATLLFYALHKGGFSRWLAAAVCISIVSLPSFQIYASWAATSEAPFAAILGGLAWLRLQTAFGLRRRGALLRGAEATGLLLIALLTYQPAAMFFWVFAAIEVLRPGERLVDATRKLIAGLGVAIVAIAFGFAAVKVGVHFYGGVTAGRTTLVHDLVGKVQWFWNEPLRNSLGMFDLAPTASLAIAIAIVAAVGILLLHADKGWRALGFLGLATGLVPLSYLPSLAVAEEFASYRSIGALSTLLMLYAWLGLWGIARAVIAFSARSRARQAVVRVVTLASAALLSFLSLAVIVLPLWHVLHSTAAPRVSVGTLAGWHELAVFVLLFVVFAGLGLWMTESSWERFRLRPTARFLAVGTAGLAVTAFVLTGVLLAARNVTTLMVKPQSVELHMLRSALANPSAPAPQRVVFIKPNRDQGAAPLVRYDEFGSPSTYFAWVPNPAVLLVLNEGRRQRALPAIEVLAWTTRASTGSEPGEIVVDMRKLQERRVGWSLWTLRAAVG
jgi:hypothetical protein